MRFARPVLVVAVLLVAAGCADSARYDLGQDEVPTSVPITTTVVEVDASLVSAVASTTTVAPENSVVHEIRSGDVLYDLAIFYGTTVDAIVAVNGISDPAAMTIGDELVIPTSDR